jgi:hypothetical protein
MLSQTDSTAAGWLHKSNIADSEDKVFQMTAARQLASLTNAAKSCLHSQWFLGGDNVVSDALSSDLHLSFNDLSILITSLVPDRYLLVSAEPSKQNILMADMLATKSTLNQAVVERTYANQARAWARYTRYLFSIACQHDIFLESFTRAQKHRIFSAFAHAIREGRYSSKHHPKLESKSIHATLDCMFKLADKPIQDWIKSINLPSFYSATSRVTPIQTNHTKKSSTSHLNL